MRVFDIIDMEFPPNVRELMKGWSIDDADPSGSFETYVTTTSFASEHANDSAVQSLGGGRSKCKIESSKITWNRYVFIMNKIL